MMTSGSTQAPNDPRFPVAANRMAYRSGTLGQQVNVPLGQRNVGTAVAPTEEAEVPLAEASLLRKFVNTKVISDTCYVIETLKSDDGPPLRSIHHFEELNLKPKLLEGMTELGFRAPTKIQGSVLACLVVDPRANILAQSQSGTGKTAAFAISMLNTIRPHRKFPQALCVAPTVELAKQICDTVNKLSQFMEGVSAITAIRGMPVTPNKILEHQIVVGTPGTVLDWIRRQKVIDIGVLQMFVLDEADVMLSMQGFIEQSSTIMRMLPEHCRIGLFSATYQPMIVQLARSEIQHLVEFTLKPQTEFMGNITQLYAVCASRQERFDVVHGVYQSTTVGKSMIFCKTRASAQWICEKLHSLGGLDARVISGDMDINERANSIVAFKEGFCRCLIATNVVARGIDIEGVNLVINYDLPMQLDKLEPDYETYLHRVGRTGRLGVSGLAINLIDESEKVYIEMIKRKYGIEINEITTENYLLA